MPARLSGGQAHRVALGRLLLAHCDALLLDEPYTGLDASLRRTLTDLVVTLVVERAVPAVLVAHELADAQAFADRLAVLDRGCLLQVGAPDEVVLRPASRRVAELVGYLGFVPVSGVGSGVGSETSGGTAAGQAVAGIHPDRVAAGALPDRGLVLTGTVTGFRPAGAGWEADLRVGDAMIICRLPDKPGPTDGEIAVTALDPPYFGADGAALPAAPADDGLSRAGAGSRVTTGADSGMRLRLARQARGFSQQRLAGMIGVSRQAVSAVESGLSDPSLRVALALSRALGMTIEEMFDREPRPSRSPRTRWHRSARPGPGWRSRRWAIRSSRSRFPVPWSPGRGSYRPGGSLPGPHRHRASPPARFATCARSARRGHPGHRRV